MAVVALWLILRAWLRGCNRWGLVTGGVLLAGALAWFLLVTAYLSRYGDGVMTNRYQNFMYGGSGSLFSVILAVLLSPMKFMPVVQTVPSKSVDLVWSMRVGSMATG